MTVPCECWKYVIVGIYYGLLFFTFAILTFVFALWVLGFKFKKNKK